MQELTFHETLHVAGGYPGLIPASDLIIAFSIALAVISAFMIWQFSSYI